VVRQTSGSWTSPGVTLNVVATRAPAAICNPRVEGWVDSSASASLDSAPGEAHHQAVTQEGFVGSVLLQRAEERFLLRRPSGFSREGESRVVPNAFARIGVAIARVGARRTSTEGPRPSARSCARGIGIGVLKRQTLRCDRLLRLAHAPQRVDAGHLREIGPRGRLNQS
jgi:hypothetical protein